MPNLPLEKRQELKGWLLHGDVKRIAKQINRSDTSVYKWLANDEIQDFFIQQVVVDLAALRKEQAKEAAQLIAKENGDADKPK